MLQTSAEDPEAALKVYASIFEGVKAANEPSAVLLLHQSISEYITNVLGRFARLGLQSDPRTRETLFKAWEAYLRLDRSQLKGSFPEPDFARAFEAIGAQKEARGMILQAIADPTVPRSYTLLSAGAEVARADEPLQAIGFLRAAKAFLPQQTKMVDGKPQTELDVNEAARLYDRLVSLLEVQKNWGEAIVEQRERIVQTGGGRGKLWVLLGQVGDQAGQNAVMDELKKPDLQAREVLRAVKMWLNLPDQKPPAQTQTRARVKELLAALLLPTRELRADEAIEARGTLATLRLRDGELEAAAEAAGMEKPSLLPRSQNFAWRELERLQTQIAARIREQKEAAEKPEAKDQEKAPK